jgi:hypothetical protein
LKVADLLSPTGGQHQQPHDAAEVVVFACGPDRPQLGVGEHAIAGGHARLSVVEAVLNHVSGHKAGVAGVYNKATYEREMRAALLLWAERLRSIVAGEDCKVVPLRPAGEAAG